MDSGRIVWRKGFCENRGCSGCRFLDLDKAGVGSHNGPGDSDGSRFGTKHPVHSTDCDGREDVVMARSFVQSVVQLAVGVTVMVPFTMVLMALRAGHAVRRLGTAG
jgi:hypothetical protein